MQIFILHLTKKITIVFLQWAIHSKTRFLMASLKNTRQIGEIILQKRKEKRVSQVDLAKRAGVNRTYLSMIENGKSSPTFDVVVKIARSLGMSISDLLTDEKARNYVYESETEFEIYPGLKELLGSEKELLLINPTEEEIELLKSIRLKGPFKPSKQFFIDALLDYRRSKK